MDGQFKKNPYVNEHEDADYSPENSEDSPRAAAAIFNDSKMVSTSSPKQSRRAIQKRVISVPIKDVEGSRLKGETPPPSDSWAWRKYGQKPIKGSPYPRGYYRCSSSKGCPARKQVERSRLDPTMLVVTYSGEHNHPWPASKNNNNNNNMQKLVDNSTTLTTTTTTEVEVTSVSASVSNSDEEVTVFENHFAHLGEESLIGTYEFKWFSDFGSSSSPMLESPILGGGDGGDRAVIFPMGEEDESLFADLGELPECSVVFRREVLGREEEERRRCNLAPWCGTTS